MPKHYSYLKILENGDIITLYGNALSRYTLVIKTNNPIKYSYNDIYRNKSPIKKFIWTIT